MEDDRSPLAPARRHLGTQEYVANAFTGELDQFPNFFQCQPTLVQIDSPCVIDAATLVKQQVPMTSGSVDAEAVQFSRDPGPVRMEATGQLRNG